MILEIIRLLLDFGLMVLIWMIQLIVYPSFLYYRTKNLVAWHKEYIGRLNPIIIPLMFGQVGISIYQLTVSANLYTITSLSIISIIWMSTFFQFVPIHYNISKEKISKQMLKLLIKKNWIRTVLWSLLFLISICYYAIWNV